MNVANAAEASLSSEACAEAAGPGFRLAAAEVSGGATCASSVLLCDPNVSFSAGVDTGNAEAGPDYGCLGSQPNPGWYSFSIAYPGDIDILIDTDPCVDIDYILYGPFNDPDGNCGNLTAANTTDCSFAGGCNNETFSIVNGQVADFYILLVTNFSNTSANVDLIQTGGAGALGGPLGFDPVSTGPYTTTSAGTTIQIIPPITDPNITDVTFAGAGITSLTQGDFDPAVAGPGTHAIIIEGNSYGCPVITATTITVCEPPNATIEDRTFCEEEAEFISLSTTFTATTTVGGEWLGDVQGETLNYTGPGTYNVAYRVGDAIGGVCQDLDQATITVLAEPIAEWNPPTLCTTSDPIDLDNYLENGSTTGGTWSGAGGVTAAGVFDPAAADEGTYEITYTVAGNAACPAATYSAVVTVNTCGDPCADLLIDLNLSLIHI